MTTGDNSPYATVEELDQITKGPEYGAGLIAAAEEALRTDSRPIASGVGLGKPTKRSRYEGARFKYEDRTWAVGTTRLVSSSAQLLEATIAFKHLKNADTRFKEAERAIAILEPPLEVTGPNGAPPDYLLRYRRAAWHGFGVAWVTKDAIADGWTVDRVGPPTHTAWFDDLADQVLRELGEMCVDPDTCKRSDHDAEPIVCPIVERLLVARGFGLQKKADLPYQAFWRVARSDGAWKRDSEDPKLVALEVKLNEDTGAPFCQVVENLGRADAVIQVRLVKRKTRDELAKLAEKHPWLRPLKAEVQARLPVRFIEWDPEASR
jgi:hypothetical protein